MRGFAIIALLTGALDSGATTDHWAFRAPTKPAIPTVQASSWPRSTIDRFVLARRERAKLDPNPDAEAQVLLRRICFDLIGLPPSREQLQQWTPRLRRDADEALPQLVDELLAHPGFGQRWGKHWLDVVRFAESAGQSRNISYRFAWHYRNWVIDAINQDLPYDRFIREQLAGDLLPAANRAQLERQHTATGFLLVGPKLLNENNTSLRYRMGVVDDQIDTTFRAFMGLTVGCARCHDHFYDPIPTRDYYALAGIFRSTKNLAGVKSNNNNIDNGLFPLGEDGQAIIDQIEAADKHFKAVTPAFTKARRAQMGLQNDLKDAMAAGASSDQIAKLEKDLETAKKVFKEKSKIFQAARRAIPEPPPSVMAVKEGAEIADCELFGSGDVGQPGDKIPRGALAFLRDSVPFEKIGTNQSGRMQLADWITHPRNPLTARVAVNRVWRHLFGRGLVETPDNFGNLGAKPTHPQLLDHLAIRFVEADWSLKRLVKLLVLSRAYRLSSDHSPAAFAVDADNRLLWRMNRRRLESEAVRDAMLFAAGSLASDHHKGSVVSEIGNFEMKTAYLNRLRGSYTNGNYRSVYLPVVRAALPDMMKVFDGADPSLVVGNRDVTTVAPQALFLLNNEFVLQQAEQIAGHLVKSVPARERITAAFELVLSRPPTNTEHQLLARLAGEEGSSEVWTEISHGLLASGEFRTLY